MINNDGSHEKALELFKKQRKLSSNSSCNNSSNPEKNDDKKIKRTELMFIDKTIIPEEEKNIKNALYKHFIFQSIDEDAM
jgi:hypothetical protein